jgi:hypothetical protein
MSTPIQPGELSPEDPKFYAPPKWRSGEITAPPIQPSLRSPELPTEASRYDETSFDEPMAHHHAEISFDEPKVHRHAEIFFDEPKVHRHAEIFFDEPMTHRHADMSFDEPMTDAFLKPHKHLDQPGNSAVARKAFAIAAGVVIWTAICIFVGLGRLDTISFAQLRNVLPSAGHPEVSVGERPQAESSTLQQAAYDPPQNPSPDVPAPTLAVAGAIGEANTALPLAVSASNYPPGTSILLTGLVTGTRLSSGSAAGESRWRIAIDDLPNTQVFPPADFVGPMTVIAELRNGDDQAIVRSPLQLVWRPAAIKSSKAVEPVTPPAAAAVADETSKENPIGQALAWQKESTATQPAPRVKARKYISRTAGAKRRQHNASSSLDMETDTVSRWKTAPASNYATSAYSDARAERRSFWSADLQNLIDGSWERCRYNCAREPRR